MADEIGKSSREADHWKKKYYDSLDELDEKQREWQYLEKQLRLLVSRLSLIAESHDPRLDKKLEKLRNQIRESDDLLRLQPMISDIASAIAALPEKDTDHSGRDNRVSALQQLLDQITIPGELARQEKYVRKKLDRVSGITDMPDAVKVLAELLTMVIERGAVGSGSKQGMKSGKSGLFSGLFGRVPDSEPAPEPVSRTVEVKPTDTQQSVQADADVTQSAGTVDEHKFEDDNTIACSLAGEILIQLLERIDFSDDLAVESELIRKRLEPCEDIDVLKQGLESTVSLIANLQNKIQSEKQELEDFLLQLTSRLHELDKDIQQTARLRDTSLSESRDMNQAVNSQVNSIQQSMEAGLDLDTLKTAIQSRVVIIRNHVDRFLEQEEGRDGEARQIIERLEQQLSATEQESEQLRHQIKAAQNKAETDSLTGIANRMAYDKRLNEELARHKRYKTDFVLMLWDVDKFKDVNDTYGHAAGDKVLKIVAGVMQKELRETDFLARYGGEEFAVILVESDIEAARIVGEKLRQAIEALEFHFRGTRVPVTASCGLARAGDDEDAARLFERADGALYRAKENGRNRIEIADA